MRDTGKGIRNERAYIYVFAICWIISAVAWTICLIYAIKTHEIIPMLIALLFVQVFNVGILITRLLY